MFAQGIFLVFPEFLKDRTVLLQVLKSAFADNFPLLEYIYIIEVREQVQAVDR